MLEGRARSLLFDQVSFTFANGARTAESAGVLYAAYLTHGASLYHLETIQEDTTLASLRDAYEQLHEQEWIRMRHPKPLVDLIDDWDEKKGRFGDRDGHPMAQLLAVTEEAIVLEDDEPDLEEIDLGEIELGEIDLEESETSETEPALIEEGEETSVEMTESEETPGDASSVDAEDSLEEPDEFEIEEFDVEVEDLNFEYSTVGSVADPETR